MENYITINNNTELYNAIVGARKLIDNYVKEFSYFDHANFDGYQKIYIGTNELIGEYLSLLDLKDKKRALSVASSGDHTFNLICEGILDIDTFDSNKLTEYYAFGLKRAMIIKYDYKTYLSILTKLCNRTCSCDTITQIIFELLPLMDEKYRIFWKEIILYSNKVQKEYGLNTNPISIMGMAFLRIKSFINNNKYLINEVEYNILRNNITKANITFTPANARNLDKAFDGKKYDLIVLSNILDYFSHIWGFNWKIDELDKFSEKLEKLMNKDGIVLLNYIYSYKYMTPGKYYTKGSTVIRNSDISYDDLDNYEVLQIDNYPSDETLDMPALLLKRY